MPTLSICSSKGGVAKTTLSACIASMAIKDGLKVALIDLDPQQSLARWWELRDCPDNPRLVVGIDTVAEAVRVLEESGFDLIIVDTPPALMQRIAPAIAVADLVLVPVRPSPLDVEAIDPIVKLTTKHDVPFAFILTMVKTGSDLADSAREFLDVDGEVLSESISFDEVFSTSMTSGQTAAEVGSARSKFELTKVWALLKQQLFSDNSLRAVSA